MTKLDYQSAAERQGVKHLKLLGKYSEQLMQCYLGGEFDEIAAGERAVAQLLDADILWRPNGQSGLKLMEPVTDLISHLLKDEKRRKINTEVGDFHQSIRHLVTQVHEAQQRGDYGHITVLQRELQQEVDDLNSRISTGIKSLWRRLNQGFAFVDRLDEKIYENEKASKEVSRWLEGLEQINFNELIRLVDHHAALRNILVRQLQGQVSAHLGNLRETQKRLSGLLVSFREQHERNMLVRAVLQHFKQNPQFRPNDYAQLSNVHALINIAAPLVPAVAISLERNEDEYLLRQLLQKLPTKAPRQSQLQTEPVESFSLQEDETVLAQRKVLQEQVTDFFIEVHQSKKPQSALAYYQRREVSWPADIWLYQVVAEYYSLSKDDAPFFYLHYVERAASETNQLLVVEDLELRPTG